MEAVAANASCERLYVPLGVVVVNVGRTSESVASGNSAASPEFAPSTRNDCTPWHRPPTSRQTPTTPFRMIINAA
jgi:hypothetical protein